MQTWQTTLARGAATAPNAARRERPLPRRYARRPDAIRWVLKPTIWLAALTPFLLLVHDALTDNLGAEPIEAVTHRTGWWALALLMATLAITPLRRLTGLNRLVKVRRLVGLFAFFYAVLHVAIYLVDQGFALDYVREDVLERPYITMGFSAFLLLTLLAATSTRGMIRRLGRHWGRLHRTVYLAAGLAVVHFLWLVKADVREPLIFATVLAVLLALRLPRPRRGA